MWQTLLCGKRRLTAAGNEGCRCPTRWKSARVGGGQTHGGQQQHVSSDGTSWLVPGTRKHEKLSCEHTSRHKAYVATAPPSRTSRQPHAPDPTGERKRQDSNTCDQWACDGVPEDRRDEKTILSIIKPGPPDDKQGDHAITFMLKDMITKARHHNTDTQQTDTTIQTAYNINRLGSRIVLHCCQFT